MKILGDRISILEKEDVLSIVILSTADKKKLMGLFLWLLAWSVCGVIVLANYFTLADQKAKLFVIIYMSFWAYFEYNIIKVFLWKRSGKEKIWIQSGQLHYQREISGRGKIKQYDAHLISKPEIIELSKTSFADTINQSFWVKGGERIKFESQGKEVRLAMQISDEEARVIQAEISKFIVKHVGNA